MQFIDQPSSYNQKSIAFDRAIATNRAKVLATPGSEKLAQCFRPELKIAKAFDLDIDERVNFNSLPAGEKMDLLIEELLPRFFHPDLLSLTAKPVWHVRFVVDGSVKRTLRLDDLGLHDVSGNSVAPDVEIETDIFTLLAMLRAEIANFHRAKPPYPQVPRGADGEDMVDDDVSGS